MLLSFDQTCPLIEQPDVVHMLFLVHTRFWDNTIVSLLRALWSYSLSCFPLPLMFKYEVLFESGKLNYIYVHILLVCQLTNTDAHY